MAKNVSRMNTNEIFEVQLYLTQNKQWIERVEMTFETLLTQVQNHAVKSCSPLNLKTILKNMGDAAPRLRAKSKAVGTAWAFATIKKNRQAIELILEALGDDNLSRKVAEIYCSSADDDSSDGAED